MITLIKPIVFAFFKSEGVKRLLVDVLEKLAKESDNEVDDALVEGLKRALRLS